VHATGIKFNHAFLVGQSAEPDAVVFRIVFWPGNDQDRRIQRIAAFADVFKGAIELRKAVVGTDNNWLLAHTRPRLRRRSVVHARNPRSILQSVAFQSKGKRAQRGRGKKFATGKAHLIPPEIRSRH